MLIRALAVSLAAALLQSSIALAAFRPGPTVTPVVDRESRTVIVGTSSSSAMCTLGPGGTAENLVDYILPPNDNYFILLRQNTCSACGAGSLMRLTEAHVTLSFPTTPCTVHVDVGVVQATGTSCPLPDPMTEHCSLASFALVPPAQGGIVDFTIPLASCYFGERAFLQVSFQGFSASCNTMGERPQLVTSNTCTACTNYNTYDLFRDDLCEPGSGFPGNLIMSADVGSCGVLDAGDTGRSHRVQLGAGYPNPAPAGVTIPFTLAESAEATLRILDVAGGVVRTLAAGTLAAGSHVARWNRTTDAGEPVRPGVYFYELRSGGTRLARPVVIVR